VKKANGQIIAVNEVRQQSTAAASSSSCSSTWREQQQHATPGMPAWSSSAGNSRGTGGVHVLVCYVECCGAE
jgi:hypothetical protein